MSDLPVPLLEACALFGAQGDLKWTITLSEDAQAQSVPWPSLARFCFLEESVSSVSSEPWTWKQHSWSLTGSRGESRLSVALLFGSPLRALCLVTRSLESTPSVLHHLALALVAPCADLNDSALKSNLTHTIDLLLRLPTVPRELGTFVALRLPLSPSALHVVSHARPSSPRVRCDPLRSCLTLLLSEPSSPWTVPYVDSSLSSLLLRGSLESLLHVFSSLLSEGHVALVSSQRRALSEASRALLALLHPFPWQHVTIPLLPASLIDFLQAPTPFLMGVPLSASLPRARVLASVDEETLVWDLDTGELFLDARLVDLHDTDTLPLPLKATSELRARIGAELSARSEEEDADSATSARLRWDASMDDRELARAFQESGRTKSNVALQRHFLWWWREVLSGWDLVAAVTSVDYVSHKLNDLASSSNKNNNTESDSDSDSEKESGKSKSKSKSLSFYRALIGTTAWDELLRLVRDDLDFASALHAFTHSSYSTSTSSTSPSSSTTSTPSSTSSSQANPTTPIKSPLASSVLSPPMSPLSGMVSRMRSLSRAPATAASAALAPSPAPALSILTSASLPPLLRALTSSERDSNADTALYTCTALPHSSLVLDLGPLLSPTLSTLSDRLKLASDTLLVPSPSFQTPSKSTPSSPSSSKSESEVDVEVVSLTLRLSWLMLQLSGPGQGLSPKGSASGSAEESALRVLSSLFSCRSSLPLSHDGQLYDLLFSSWEKSSSPSSVRVAISSSLPPMVQSQHAAYLLAKSSRAHAALQQRVQAEAAVRVQQRRVTWLSHWLLKEVQSAHVTTALGLAPLPWDDLGSLELPSSWQSSRDKGHVPSAEVAAWLVLHSLCASESEGDAPLVSLLRALHGDILLDTPHTTSSTSSAESMVVPDSIELSRLQQFVAALRARLDQLTLRDLPSLTSSTSPTKSSFSISTTTSTPLSSERSLLRMRCSAGAVRGEVVFSAKAVTFGSVRLPWPSLRHVQGASVSVLFTPLPCVRFTPLSAELGSPLTLCFAHERARSLALLCAQELWLGACLSRDLEDTTPLWRASVRVLVAQALSDLPPPSSRSLRESHARRSSTATSASHASLSTFTGQFAASSLALRLSASESDELRLAQSLQDAGLLNDATPKGSPALTPPRTPMMQTPLKALPPPRATPLKTPMRSVRPPPPPLAKQPQPQAEPSESEADEANELVLTLLAQAMQLLAVHSSSHSHSNQLTQSHQGSTQSSAQGQVPSTPLRSAQSLPHDDLTRAHTHDRLNLPTRTPGTKTRARSGSSGDSDSTPSSSSGGGVAWTRLRSSREYESFCIASAALRSLFVSPSELSPEQRFAFLVNLYNLMVLHGVFVVGSVPSSLLEWRLFSRFVVYDLGGLPYSLDLVHRLLRGQGAQEGCVADALLAQGDPRSSWLIPTCDARVHFLLSSLTASSPRVRLVTPHNLEAHLSQGAEDFCSRSIRLEGATLVLPTLFSWYLPDFTAKDSEDKDKEKDKDKDMDKDKEKDNERGGGKGEDKAVASLLRWLPLAQQSEMARAIDDPHFELRFEHNWTTSTNLTLR